MRSPGTDIAQIAQIARNAGWRAALHDHLRAASPDLYRYASDPQSAGWRLLLDTPPPAARILMLDPGIGVAPFLFAADGADVDCACALPSEAGFLTARAEQQGLPGLAAFEREPGFPPPHSAYDLVVAVGVLGPSLTGDRPAIGLTELFEIAREQLSDNGGLFIADDARRLPRLGAMRKKLARGGFHDVRAFGLVPSHWQPFFTLPLDEPTSLRHACRRIASGYDFRAQMPPALWSAWRGLAGPSVNALAAVGLTGTVARAMPAYGFVCRKGGTP